MTIEQLPFRGAKIIRGARHPDDRGDFRVLLPSSATSDLEIGHPPLMVASAYNASRGTVRGLHYQVDPFPETKTLWCTAGEVFDVLVDLRDTEPTYGQWISVRMTEEAVAVHIPPGIAHGYQTLTDNAVITYLISGEHHPDYARTLQWNDSRLGIDWPLDATVVSPRDREGTPWPPQS